MPPRCHNIGLVHAHVTKFVNTSYERKYWNGLSTEYRLEMYLDARERRKYFVSFDIKDEKQHMSSRYGIKLRWDEFLKMNSEQ